MEQKKLFNILALSSLFITYSPESNFCNGGMFGECLQFITSDEVKDILECLQLGKAVGSDLISHCMLKKYGFYNL
jgi:hypothetical protein